MSQDVRPLTTYMINQISINQMSLHAACDGVPTDCIDTLKVRTRHRVWSVGWVWHGRWSIGGNGGDLCSFDMPTHAPVCQACQCDANVCRVLREQRRRHRARARNEFFSSHLSSTSRLLLRYVRAHTLGVACS